MSPDPLAPCAFGARFPCASSAYLDEKTPLFSKWNFIFTFIFCYFSWWYLSRIQLFSDVSYFTSHLLEIISGLFWGYKTSVYSWIYAMKWIHSNKQKLMKDASISDSEIKSSQMSNLRVSNIFLLTLLIVFFFFYCEKKKCYHFSLITNLHPWFLPFVSLKCPVCCVCFLSHFSTLEGRFRFSLRIKLYISFCLGSEWVPL